MLLPVPTFSGPPPYRPPNTQKHTSHQTSSPCVSPGVVTGGGARPVGLRSPEQGEAMSEARVPLLFTWLPGDWEAPSGRQNLAFKGAPSGGRMGRGNGQGSRKSEGTFLSCLVSDQSGIHMPACAHGAAENLIPLSHSTLSWALQGCFQSLEAPPEAPSFSNSSRAQT